MRARGSWRWSAAVLVVVVLGACSSGGGSEGVAPTTTSTQASAGGEGASTIRELADERGVTLGTAVSPEPLASEPPYEDRLLETFNSVTPENDLKWAFVHPAPNDWDFAPVDQLVEFAEQHDLAVKGHNLVWDQAEIDSTPDWVLAIDDPDELREALRTHITTLMERYDGRIDRWDVVNEPLETTGTALYRNHFAEVLGEGYLAEVFALARAADPDAELCLNEVATELISPKADAFVDLVAALVDDGVPIDCVGLQGHLLAGTVEPGAIEGMVEELSALGLDVAITELDVPVADGADDPLATQADTYGQVFEECFAAGCDEVTLWGFTDAHTWIDDLLGPDLQPLPYDASYEPKPALDAIRASLEGR